MKVCRGELRLMGCLSVGREVEVRLMDCLGTRVGFLQEIPS